MRETIVKVVLRALKDLNEDLNGIGFENPDEKTNIYGKEGKLDSMTLVRLIVAIEESISQEFNRSIVIADEKAMSQSKSPFRTVESLTDYIEELLNDGKNA